MFPVFRVLHIPQGEEDMATRAEAGQAQMRAEKARERLRMAGIRAEEAARRVRAHLEKGRARRQEIAREVEQIRERRARDGR